MNRPRRIAAGLISAAALAALMAGIPYALARLGSGVLPDHVPSLAAIRDDLLHRDDTGRVFACALVLVGWLAWASFAFSVSVEIGARLRGGRRIRVPGLRVQQRTAAALIGAVLLMFSTPLAASAAMAHGGPATSRATRRPPVAAILAPPTGLSGSPGQTGGPGTAIRAPNKPVAPDPMVYEVRHGDYLGSIAARFEGDFDAYRQLALANHIADPDLILPGWTIVLPAGATDRGPHDHATGTVIGPKTSVPGPVASSGGTGEPPPSPLAASPSPSSSAAPPGSTSPAPASASTQPSAAPRSASANPSAASVAPAPAPTRPSPTAAAAAPTSAVPTSARATSTVTRSTVSRSTVSRSTVSRSTVSRSTVSTSVPSTSPASLHASDGDGSPGAAPADSGEAGAGGPTAAEILAASGTLAIVVAIALAVASRRATSRREQLEPERPGRAQHERGTYGREGPIGERLGRRSVRTSRSAIDAAARRLMEPVRPDDVLRLDASLRSLAAAVEGRPVELMPQIPAVWLDGGDITLILADDCWPAPDPFERVDDGWRLPAEAVFPAYSQRVAPLPTLVTVGGQIGAHLLLDLEYLRFLGVVGDPAACVDLMRYIAAELVHNVWSDDVRVVLAGFGAEAGALASLAPDRVRVQPSVPEAVNRFRQRLARAVANREAPAAPPEVLIAASPQDTARSGLADLAGELMEAPGVGFAALVGPLPDRTAGRYALHLDSGGLLRAGFLGDAVMPAASLPSILAPEVAALVAEARRHGDTSPIDLARAASRAALRAASGERPQVPPRARMAGQHRRAPGVRPRPRDGVVDLMRPRHAARG